MVINVWKVSRFLHAGNRSTYRHSRLLYGHKQKPWGAFDCRGCLCIPASCVCFYFVFISCTIGSPCFSVNTSIIFWLVRSISSFRFKSTGFALYWRSNNSEARLRLVPTFRRPAPSHSERGRGKNDTCVGSEITMLPSSATQWLFFQV